MLSNFLIVAVRNFFKQRTQSILNVSGLAIGLACSIYAYLYAFDELTYDTQHPNAGNTYRIIFTETDAAGAEFVEPWAMVGWGNYLKENLNGIKDVASLNTVGWPHSFYYTPKNEEQRIVLSENVVYATENYADFFYLDLIAGDKNRLFEHPTDMLISESAARELFGNESALNKQLEFSHPFYLGGAKTSVVVKGVYKDMPFNLQFGRTTRYMLNRAINKPKFERWPDNPPFEKLLDAMWWPAYSANVYFQAEPDVDLQYVKEKLEAVINKAGSPSYMEPEFVKITDSHFSQTDRFTYPEMAGNKQYIYIFLTIGAFILLISCMNYTNLATARSMQRAKEVGMRKAMGSRKSQIVLQFLQESLLVTGLSMILALLIAIAFLPIFSDFANKDFVVADIFSMTSITVMLLLWLIVSVCSGFYPALYIASLQTLKILKGALDSGKGGNLIRQSLMVFQFSVSLILIVFTFVVIRQMNEMVNSDLNKQGDQVLSIRYSNIAPLNKLQAFRNELSRVSDLAVSDYGNHLPRKDGFPPLAYQATMPDKSNEKYILDLMMIGPDFPKVHDLELIAGSFFDSSLAMDSSEVLVNESMARQLNVDPGELVGQQIAVQHARRTQEQYHFKIRGVLKDFKYKSMEHKILPLVLTTQGNLWDVIYYIKLPADGIQENIATIQQIWKKVMPEDVGLSYWFISDEFNKMYFEENALHDLSRVFSVLAIITTCIGLFGMSMFLAERKRKEIAIRKVMGAGSSNLVKKMTMPFIKLMAIACLIGIPVAFYFSNKWLDNFVYKIEWSWLIILFSVLLILAVTLFTVFLQAFKSANANPVNALKE